MRCDEERHIYKIRVIGTGIEEWYSLSQHASLDAVEELWLSHLREADGMRAKFAESFSGNIEVENICQTRSGQQEGRKVRQVEDAEIQAAVEAVAEEVQ